MKSFRARVAVLWLFAAATAAAQQRTPEKQQAPLRLHAGPAYTRGDDQGPQPRFPEIDAQMEVPPGTDAALLKPEAFLLQYGDDSYTGSSIQQLGTTGYGVAAAFVLDVSGSMRGAPLEAVRSGLSRFVEQTGAEDRFAIETVADDARWDSEWGNNREQAKASLARLAVRGHLTRLWDSVTQAAGSFPETPLSRRLIVISDGHDEGSSHSQADAIAAAKRNHVVVDALGMTRSSLAYLQTLKQLATETGGSFRLAQSTAELQELVVQGIGRLRAAPVVRFRLEGVQADGNGHNFVAVWKHSGAESQDALPVTFPVRQGMTKRTVYLLAGGGALLLAVIAFALLRRGKRKQLPPLPAPVPEPKVAPQRTETVFQSPSRTPRYDPAPAAPAAASIPVAPAAPRPQPAAPPPQPAARRASTEFLGRFSPPSAQQPGAWLFAEQGPMAGLTLPLMELETWVGTLDGNQIQVSSDATLSANHACFVFDHDVLSLHDNQSTNGSWVNGEQVRVGRKLLRPGDRVRLGRSTFAVEATPRNTDAR